MPGADRSPARAGAAAVAIFLAVYLPALGRGFVKDDFAWMTAARIGEPADLLRIFGENTGFYRPLVTLSFALDYALWGLEPFGYGVTNLLLCLAGAALIAGLAVRLGLPGAAALVAAAAWLFNFHAVNMALLWLSGRTALLLVVCALATAHAMHAGRRWLAGLACFGALLSKEEAVAIPALWTAYEAWPGPHRRAARAAFLRTAPLWIALVPYFVLRSRSGAFSPSEAPWFYQFTFEPAVVARNVLEYADRAGTTAALVMIVIVGFTGWRRLRLAAPERRAVLLGALWIPAAYALTVFLPVRSSLYALFPAVGTSLVAAGVASAAHRADAARFRRAAIALLVVAALLLPVYRARNDRWTGAADLSARTMAVVSDVAAQRSHGHVVLADDTDARVTYDAAFSSALPDALHLFAGPGWTGEIVPPGTAIPPNATLVIGLRDGMPVVTQAIGSAD